MELISITQMMNMIKTYKIKTKQTYLEFCRRSLLPSLQRNGTWYIKKEYLTTAIQWREQALYVEDIIESILSDDEIISPKWETNKRNLNRKIKKYFLADNEYSILFAGKFIDSSSLNTIKSILENEKNTVFGLDDCITLSQAADKLNLSKYQVRRLIDYGRIEGKFQHANWFIPVSDINNFKVDSEELISIYSIADRISSETKTNFDINNRNDRSRLNAHMRLSELKGNLVSWEKSGLHTERKNALYINKKDEAKAVKIIESFLQSYCLSRNTLDSFLCNSYFDQNPQTRDIILKFADNHNKKSVVAIASAIVETIDCEITFACDDDIRSIMEIIAQTGIQRYRKDFVHFISQVKKDYKCSFSLEFSLTLSPNKHQPTSTVIPYSSDQFIEFGRLCVDFETAANNSMFEKAIARPQLAYTWLFSAWHLIGAWRKGDIEKQIPILPTPMDWENIRNTISTSEFDQLALDYSYIIQTAINNGELTPSKTKNKQKERFLSIHIPTSQRLMIGRIYIIYAKHCNDNASICKNLSFKSYYDLFGDDYYRCFGKKALSNRRANKTYLNLISEIVSSEKGVSSNILSYRIASYARAHVERNGLAETTSKYLMNKMDGLSSDEIIIRLFENGFCSFTVRYLLEIAYGDRFGKLRFKEQADIIKKMNLSAFKAESIANVIDDSYHKSRIIVNNLFREYNCESVRKNNAVQILNNLGKRIAVSNINGISCLIIASRKECPYRYLRQCAGCKYSIYDFSFFTTLINSINQSYCELKRAKTEGTKRIIQARINQEMLPAAYEIMFLAKNQFNYNLNMYIDKLIEITKQGGIEIDQA